jgi:eukaryotic-like serine/threonine-protein kinase
VPTIVRSLFRNYALLSGLVKEDQIQQALERLRGSGTTTSQVEFDDNGLAAKMVEMGFLTAYQAEKIKEGRSKFTIGPYTVIDFIGQGGMGQVFKATHDVMGRESAVKVLPLAKATPDSIHNFTREIRMQARLDHPNLVRAYDAGRDGDVHYLVTEYVPGTDLRKLIRSRGPLSQQQAASVILQAARGLEYAHQQGLIHRDVKPGNILVTPEGIAKVSDLGLAAFMQSSETDPRAGKIVGTADYLSPEQIRTPGDVTHVSDIYSLGCTLYYAVCGKVPFPGGTTREKARKHTEETPWHPRRFNVELHEEFVEVIADMMEKDPTQRIQSAGEVVSRLEQWAGDASPLPGSVRASWKAGPVPAEEDDPRLDLPQDTEGNDPSSPSQLSQGTVPFGMAYQETLPTRPALRPIPLGIALTAINWTHVLATAAICVPVSMLAGAVLAMLLSWLMR